VLRAVLPRRAEIGAYFAEVVDSWDAASLVSRLELQVGKDLQYIRINGDASRRVGRVDNFFSIARVWRVTIDMRG